MKKISLPPPLREAKLSAVTKRIIFLEYIEYKKNAWMLWRHEEGIVFLSGIVLALLLIMQPVMWTCVILLNKTYELSLWVLFAGLITLISSLATVAFAWLVAIAVGSKLRVCSEWLSLEIRKNARAV